MKTDRMIFFLIVICSFLLIGAALLFMNKEEAPVSYKNICIDGVTYIKFSNAITVKYDEDGNILFCNPTRHQKKINPDGM